MTLKKRLLITAIAGAFAVPFIAQAAPGSDGMLLAMHEDPIAGGSAMPHDGRWVSVFGGGDDGAAPVGVPAGVGSSAGTGSTRAPSGGC